MANLAPTYSALDTIKSSLRMINGLASGEEPDNATAQDALLILNQMIDGWNAERLMIPGLERQLFSFTPSQQTYTLGPGGDFDVVRPSKIDAAGIILIQTPDAELPIHMFTDEEWEEVVIKALPSNIPRGVYDDGSYPLRNLTYWGIPDGTVSAVLYTWSVISSFAALTTKLGFPPGYAEAIRYNLAARLGAEGFGEITPAIATMAVQSLGRVKTSNVTPIVLECDEAVLSGSSDAVDRSRIYYL